MQLITNSEQVTKEFGSKFAAKLKGGEVLCLFGELGTGKTTFVKGLAEGLGVTEGITSPTFTLLNVYKISNIKYPISSLVHIDTYRLKNERELIEIGAEDYLGEPGTVAVVEWPEKIPNILKNKKTLNIKLEHLENNRRKITVD